MHEVTTDFVPVKKTTDKIGDVFILINNYGVDNLWMIVSIDGAYSLIGLGSGKSWTDDTHNCIEDMFGGERLNFERLPNKSKVTLVVDN